MNAMFEEFRAALWSIWNRRWLALAVAWGVCMLGWLVVALIPNTYESNARIFVQLDDALAQQVGIGTSERKKEIERVTQTLTGAVNLEKVIRSTRIGDEVKSDADMQAAVAKLALKIKVKSTENDLFEISAKSGRSDLSDGENALLAQDIVQKLIDIFREDNLGSSRGDMRDTINFLDQQLAERQKDLEAADAWLRGHPDAKLPEPAFLAPLRALLAFDRPALAKLATGPSAATARYFDFLAAEYGTGLIGLQAAAEPLLDAAPANYRVLLSIANRLWGVDMQRQAASTALERFPAEFYDQAGRVQPAVLGLHSDPAQHEQRHDAPKPSSPIASHACQAPEIVANARLMAPAPTAAMPCRG